jgi:tRNA nucleotidyltransferase/poly(A) polymerase
MQIFVVGGAVRDFLLGETPKDIDYVVIGSSHEEMISLGFKKVGLDFPVYLHPTTNDEYALARTEKKVGIGYGGFECDTKNVTLYDDQSRRDLTINSMAVNIDDWKSFVITRDLTKLIDPFNGYKDLSDEILKHTSEAFRDDPIRVLRTARFSARYGFDIFPSTYTLMKQIAPELEFVSPDRIWLEFSKGLMEKFPEKMFNALCEVDGFRVETMRLYSNFLGFPSNLLLSSEDDISIRFSLIGGKFSESDYQKYCIPSNCANLNTLFINHASDIRRYKKLSPTDKLKLLTKLRVFNGTKTLWTLVRVVELFDENSPPRHLIQRDINALLSVDTFAIANKYKIGSIIKDKLWEARIAIITL